MKKKSNVIDLKEWKRQKLGYQKDENGVWFREWSALEVAAFDAKKPIRDEYTLLNALKLRRRRV